MLTPRGHDRAGDAGTVMLLILGYVIIAVVFVLVAIDAADVFLAQRTLSGAADGAALAGAQALDRAALYAGTGPACRLPVSGGGAAAVVLDYLEQSGLPAGYADVTPAGVSVDPATGTVTVTLHHRVRLPLGGLVGVIESRWAGGVPLTATARARSPLRAGAVGGC